MNTPSKGLTLAMMIVILPLAFVIEKALISIGLEIGVAWIAVVLAFVVYIPIDIYINRKSTKKLKDAEKIVLIKLGFKKLHGATLTNREMYSLSPKALKKYLKAGMK